MKTAIAALSVLVLILPANASAECGSDSECKGERICVDGLCVDPPAKAADTSDTVPAVHVAPPPEPVRAPPRRVDPGNEATVPSRRFVLALHPATMLVAGLIGSAAGVTAIAVPVGIEYGLTPVFALGATVTPMYFGGPGGSATGFSLGLNAKFFPGGTAPDGGWIGGGVAAGSVAGVGAFDLGIGGGWQWVFRGGFVLGLGGMLGLVSLANGTFPLEVHIPVGFAF
jgi:hypothetical protein